LPDCKIAVKCTDTENVQMNTCDVMCRNKYLSIGYLPFFLKNYASARIRDMLTLAVPTLSVRLRALSRSHFLIDFHQNFLRRKNP